MSEAELHVLKQRLQEGKLRKARRGELTFAVPVGYVRRPSGEVVFDPDEQIQQVVRLLFRKFEELGTLHALLRYLLGDGIHLGVRVRQGEGKGELQWRKPNRMTLQNMLKNPIYAGVYAYGRRQVDPRKKRPGRPSTGRVVLDPEQWHAFIEDSFPAYISLEHYDTNLRRLAANRARAEERGRCAMAPRCCRVCWSAASAATGCKYATEAPESCTPTPAAAWPPTTPKASATTCPAPLLRSSLANGS
jgi:hypothetical protein